MHVIRLAPILEDLTHALLIIGLIASVPAQASRELVDLRRIGHLSAKGRVQDQPAPIVDALIKAGPDAVPFLVSKLADRSRLSGPPVLDFWPRIEVRHVALVVLCDLLTRADGRTPTVPNASWDQILDRQDADMPSWELYDRFVAKHGADAVRLKVEQVLAPYKSKLIWDAAERCFRVAG